MLIHRLTGTVNDATLPVFNSLADQVLAGVGSGGVFLADFGLAASWSGSLVNGAVLNNVADASKPASVLLSGGGAAISAQGLDTSACTLNGNALVAPASVVSGITSGSQYFLIIAYFKLPTAADWNAGGTLWSMLQICDDGEVYTTGQQMFIVAQMSGNQISFRRQTAVGAAEQSNFAVTAHQGQICQLAYWRNASGYQAQVRSSAGGTTQMSGAVGSASAENYSASKLQAGACFGPWNDGGVAGSALTANGLKATNTSLYRVWVENLALSGRNPATVAADDYTRIMSRIGG